MCGSLAVMTELGDRTVVITGAASGLGRAFARCFRAEGASVVAADIHADGLTALASEGITTCVADVSAEDDVRRMVSVAVETTGRIDVLINNAGNPGQGRLEALGDGEFERTVAIHAFGAYYGMRAALPHMRTQGYGRIITVLSRGAEIPNPDNTPYSVGKAATFALTRSVARQVGDDDILVNGLIPGPTNTAIWGVDRPELQPPEAAYPTARMLATLPAGGPNGKVFWDLEEYRLFHPDRNGGRGAITAIATGGRA